MAVAYLGSQAIGASSGSINQTITVPANTDYAIIFLVGGVQLFVQYQRHQLAAQQQLIYIPALLVTIFKIIIFMA